MLSRWARKHYIFFLYLRSQASTQDQANDRGVNAFFKAIFDREYTQYLEEWPSIDFTRRSLNIVLARTNDTFLADPRLPGVIMKAWDVTGLSPFKLPSDL